MKANSLQNHLGNCSEDLVLRTFNDLAVAVETACSIYKGEAPFCLLLNIEPFRKHQLVCTHIGTDKKLTLVPIEAYYVEAFTSGYGYLTNQQIKGSILGFDKSHFETSILIDGLPYNTNSEDMDFEFSIAEFELS